MTQNEKWRNPYAIKPLQKKRNVDLQKPRLPRNSVKPMQKQKLKSIKADSDLSSVGPIEDFSPLKDRLTRFRTGIRDASTSIQELERTMDSLYNLLEKMEKFSYLKRRIGRNSPNLLNSISKIDFEQIGKFLQSPLVQALLSNDDREEKGD
ncbi:hypothetical protein L1765_05960 [Microaerobacter geothermalis]|uniref:hypothetical protein n=1 Tax=Microaerobacter geothermalis TaxID=674972 RepID=UPI001F293DA2|nr:hypothetical protein [Microaerobacter geothermalis]MCF6093531.1 hypothetical protein [Microaerobacter geothermalis]